MGIAGNVLAQRPVGDTVRGVEETYFYNHYTNPDNWSDQYAGVNQYSWLVRYDIGIPNCVPEFSFWNEHRNGNGIDGMQMFTEKPIKILGIAAVAFMQRWFDTTTSINMSMYHRPGLPEYNSELNPGFFFQNTLDTTVAGRVTDSLILYKTTVKEPIKLAAAPWRIEQPHRYMDLPHRGWYNYLGAHIGDPITLPLYEAMFDSPVVVDDSFIVAGTFRNNEKVYVWHGIPAYPEFGENMYLWNHQPTRYVWMEEITPSSSRRLDSNNIYWVRMDDSCTYWQRTIAGGPENYHPPRYYHNFSMLIFPIIDPVFDTVICHDVTNVTVAERSGSNATLMWNSRDPGPFEVAYGKYTDPWENFIHLTTNDPTITLTGLTRGIIYFAMVRSYCTINGEWGEWSSPVEVEVYGQDEPDAIPQPDDPDRVTYLMPNPTQGKATVVSGYGLKSVTVYDLNGKKVLQQETEGHSAEIDLSHLPDGTYIAAILTRRGIITKRLVIANK